MNMEQNLPVTPSDDPVSHPTIPDSPVNPTSPEPMPDPPPEPNPYPVSDPLPSDVEPSPITDPISPDIGSLGGGAISPDVEPQPGAQDGGRTEDPRF